MSASIETVALAAPRVSICIPAYIQPKKLEKCLRSIVAQEFRDFEVIISDDSPDGSVEEMLCSTGLGSFLCVRYERNVPSLGVPGNWNKAMDLARGTYVKMMHHDDYFLEPTALGALVAAIEARGADFAFCDSRVIATDGTWRNAPSEAWVARLRMNPSTLILGNKVGAPSAVLWRRNDVRYSESFKWLVDIECYMRYLSRFPVLIHVPEVLVATFMDETNLTAACQAAPELVVREYTQVIDSWVGTPALYSPPYQRLLFSIFFGNPAPYMSWAGFGNRRMAFPFMLAETAARIGRIAWGLVKPAIRGRPTRG
jgi:glycosyltransferase involved in cell wall biosynthesis